MDDYEKRSAQIKVERGRVKGSLTRLENSFENVNTKNEIMIRLQRLDDLLKDFLRLDSILSDEDSELAEFEDRYFLLKSKYQNKLDVFNSSETVSVSAQNSNSVSQIMPQSNIRLPKLNIPVFSGKFTEWTNFKDLFVSTVHSQASLSNIQKFQYLKGLLSDEPESLIKHIPLSNESYTEAWEKILDRYDKKKQIVQSLIKLFLEQKNIVQPNSTNIRNLLNTSDEVVRGLKALSEECTNRDPWLIYLLLQKLDFETKKLWAIKSAEVDFPTLKEFFDFLNVRCSSLELMANNENDVKHSKQSNFVGSKNPFGKQTKNCLKCQGAHPLYKCMKFKNMNVVARKNFVKYQNLCYLCLNAHKIKECPNSHFKCLRCQEKHNTLLHEDTKGNAYSASSENKIVPLSLTIDNGKTNRDSVSESICQDLKINSSASFNNSKCVSFLPTANVLLYDTLGNAYPFRALLDSGSECTFVSENVVNILNLKRKNDRIILNGIAGVAAGQTRGSVSLKIGSKLSNETINVQAYILPRVTSQLPAELLDIKNFDHLKNITLADEKFMKPKECDMILGSDCFFSILRYGRIVGFQNEPIAQNTMFGWVVAGKLGPKFNDSLTIQSHFLSVENDSNVDTILRKFWECEELPNKKKCLTEEEEFCENHFVQNYRINENGRFVVRLPVLNKDVQLDNTKSLAVSRLLAMEKKFDRDSELGKVYKAFMEEYKELNHMKIIVEENLDEKFTGKICYLPHHAVVRADSVSSKLRVVFDGTCKSANITSLNSVLGVGPVLQPDIFSILVRFRLPKIAFSSDIQQMYRQILVDKEDQDLQRIVWRESKDAKIDEFKLTTVTYGTASAPFLATRVLLQIALDIENEFPNIAALIKNSFYIDDCLSGASNVEEAVATSKLLSEILSSKGFHLRKWRSNSSEFLSEIASKKVELSNLEIHPDECSKTLGLLWDSQKDYFVFKINFKFEQEITKRSFLSHSARLFDPLGLLSPCTILIKIFYQQLWLLKLDWDSPLPEEFKVKWLLFLKNFENLNVIQIPRWIKTTSTHIYLHGFCDASEKAYAAVIYAVQPDSDCKSKVTILVAKSKVSPLKLLSIPRLELNGALLLSRLFSSVFQALSDYSIVFHAWTDSQVVLSWLSSPPANWKPYVGNRTTEILDLVPCSKWRYVPSKQNPADIASRGLSPNLLPSCELWLKGPDWLSMTEENWPKQTFKINDSIDSNILREKKKKIAYSVTLMHNDVIDSLFAKYSVLSKIIDVLTFCRKFIYNCKVSVANSVEGKNKCLLNSTIENESKYSLGAGEREKTGIFIISYIQNVYFSEELLCLKKDKPLKKSSSLCSLHPFIDSNGLLRVGGRIENSNLQYNAKHPIILPANHRFSKLLVQEFHIKHLHAGISLLSTVIKQNYWIIKGRKLIKSCINSCVTCHRYKVMSNDQLMASLPPQRVNLDRPFLHCGLDYAGPITLKFNKGRGTKTTKGYIALFVCMAIKAYHIEAVSDMTSEAFIGALRRFVARRGMPSCLYSDNGPNFVGAKRKISELEKIARENQSNKEIFDFFSANSIEWKMIPPSSPHFGGIWEAGIKAVKFHLKRVIGETLLTFEELSTLLSQIEAILNSRPLTRVTDSEISSIDVLTPSHFLIGDVIASLPERENIMNLKLLSRWELLQKIKGCFWKRFQREYLNSLQQRCKWTKKQRNIEVGDIVLLKDDNIPPGKWPMGKIIAVHPGTDGLIRVVTVKTATGLFKRPIVKLSPLPMNQE